MNTKSKKSVPLWNFLILGIALVALTLAIWGSAEGRPWEKATSTPTKELFLMATPGAGPMLEISRTPTPTDDPNWTPPPMELPKFYSTVIDLSPELSENEEYFVFVQTEAGEKVIYTIGPVISSYRDELPASIVAQIPLSPQDTLLGGVPFYPGRRSLSELLGSTPTPTINPYPLGWTPAPTYTQSLLYPSP